MKSFAGFPSLSRSFTVTPSTPASPASWIPLAFLSNQTLSPIDDGFGSLNEALNRSQFWSPLNHCPPIWTLSVFITFIPLIPSPLAGSPPTWFAKYEECVLYFACENFEYGVAWWYNLKVTLSNVPFNLTLPVPAGSRAGLFTLYWFPYPSWNWIQLYPPLSTTALVWVFLSFTWIMLLSAVRFEFDATFSKVIPSVARCKFVLLNEPKPTRIIRPLETYEPTLLT